MKTLLAYLAAVVFAATFVASSADAQTQGAQNLVPSSSDWEFESSGSTTGALTVQDGVAFVSVSSADGIRNGCLSIKDIPVVLEQPYHFHCLLSASQPCQVEVGMFRAAGGTGPNAHGAFDETVPVGTSWTPFDIDFIPDGPGMTSLTLKFFVGGCVDGYHIASPSVTAGSGSSPSPTPATGPTPVEAPIGPPNPDGWNIELFGKAQAGPIYSADGLIVDVDRPDGTAKDVQYAREGVAVANGTTYIVHFRARSTSPRTIHVEADDPASGQPIGLSEDAQLTSTWQEFNLTFTARGAATGKARIALVLGAESGTLQIAEATFSNPSMAESGPAASQSIVASSLGGLQPVARWDLDTEGSTEAMMSPAPTGAVVEIDRTDGAPAHVILKQDGIGLTEGQTYELQFKAKSTIARQIPVIAQVDGGPGGGNFRMIGCNDSVHMTPEWQGYDVKFTAVGTIPEHSRIAFLLGGAASTVELSDVALQTDNTPTQTASAQP
jgi:hypothetical protein